MVNGGGCAAHPPQKNSGYAPDSSDCIKATLKTVRSIFERIFPINNFNSDIDPVLMKKYRKF